MSNTLFDLSARGRIKVTGDDRARLLHAMTTNHIQQMKPGEGVYAFFLNAQGRIQADAYVLCFEDHFLLDTEPETRALVLGHLDKFIIADDVTLEDISEQTFCLEAAGDSLPLALAEKYSHTAWEGCTAAAITATGAPALRLYGPVERQTEITAKLGARMGSAAELNQLRLQHFKPRFGVDITDATLPQESQQMHALHFRKGCYLGQEIVERIRSRGHVNKQLMGFRMEGHEVPAATAQIFTGGKEAGEVTSAAACADGKVYGLAWVRVPSNKPGSTVGIDGRPAELVEPALS